MCQKTEVEEHRKVEDGELDSPQLHLATHHLHQAFFYNQNEMQGNLVLTT